MGFRALDENTKPDLNEDLDVAFALPFLKRGAVVFLENFQGPKELISRFETVTSGEQSAFRGPAIQHISGSAISELQSYSNYFDFIFLSDSSRLIDRNTLIRLRESLKNDGLLFLRMETSAFGLDQIYKDSFQEKFSKITRGIFRRACYLPYEKGVLLIYTNHPIHFDRGSLQKPYGRGKSLKRLHQIRLSYLQDFKEDSIDETIEETEMSAPSKRLSYGSKSFRRLIKEQNPEVIDYLIHYLHRSQTTKSNFQWVILDVLNHWESIFRRMPTIFTLFILPLVFKIIEEGPDYQAYRPQLYRIIKEMWELHYAEVEESTWTGFFDKSNQLFTPTMRDRSF